MSAADWDFLGTESARLTSLYPMSSFSDLNAKYTLWDDEALEISETFVYAGITENTLPSAAYLADGKILAEKQLVKGGYRLALQLESFWGGSTPAEAEFLE